VAEKVSSSIMQSTEIGDYLMLQLLNKVEGQYIFINSGKNTSDEIYLCLVSLSSELAVL
jgi:type VI secretion system protein ImpJ